MQREFQPAILEKDPFTKKQVLLSFSFPLRYMVLGARIHTVVRCLLCHLKPRVTFSPCGGGRVGVKCTEEPPLEKEVSRSLHVIFEPRARSNL